MLWDWRLRFWIPALAREVFGNLWHVINGRWWCPQCGTLNDRPPLKRHGLPGDRVCDCEDT